MSTPATAEVLSVSPPAMSRRRARDLWRGVARVGESTPATVGVLIILFWLAVALLAPLLAPYPPNASDLAALAHPTPSRAHWLGTDHLGRDLLSRLAWGARPVLVIAPLAVLGATALGCLLGLAAGYHRRWIDLVLTRACDIVLSFPVIILYMIILTHFGSSAWNIVGVLTLTKAPIIARIVRGLTLELREREYVAAAKMRGVCSAYATRAGEVPVIPALSFRMDVGEAMGLVGESGCGKSTVALSIVRYLGRAGRLVRGRILFEGRDLATLDAAELRAVRGRRIAMVYQDPMASLNPVMTVGRQLMEVPMIHEGVGAAAAHDRAIEMLREVKLADAAAVMTRYPHQLSGGQQQRIVIAMALIAEPALLVMDEPTTGLDVTVEAAVLDLVRELPRRRRTAHLFIRHNLGTVVRVCDRIGVMYRGELVEEGSVRQIFTDPRHPYTRGLLDCLPTLGRDKRHAPLVPIPGQLEPALARPPGCGFAARCVHVDRARCTSAPIPLLPRDGVRGQRVACVRAAELAPWTRRRPEATATDAAGASDPVISTQRLGKL